MIAKSHWSHKDVHSKHDISGVYVRQNWAYNWTDVITEHIGKLKPKPKYLVFNAGLGRTTWINLQSRSPFNRRWMPRLLAEYIKPQRFRTILSHPPLSRMGFMVLMSASRCRIDVSMCHGQRIYRDLCTIGMINTFNRMHTLQ